MKKIIEDWQNYCEKGLEFEDGYFYTLFMDEISHNEILEIYKYFPNKEELTQKMNDFLQREKLNQNTDENQNNDILKNLILQDFDDRREIINNLPEYCKLNQPLEFIYLSDSEVLKQKVRNDEWSQDFHDFLRSQRIDESDKNYELYNALWAITSDFDLRLYLFTPLLKYSYTAQKLYEFKVRNGSYAVEGNIIYYGRI